MGLEEWQRPIHQPEERGHDQQQRDEKEPEPAQDFHAPSPLGVAGS